MKPLLVQSPLPGFDKLCPNENPHCLNEGTVWLSLDGHVYSRPWCGECAAVLMAHGWRLAKKPGLVPV